MGPETIAWPANLGGRAIVLMVIWGRWMCPEKDEQMCWWVDILLQLRDLCGAYNVVSPTSRQLARSPFRIDRFSTQQPSYTIGWVIVDKDPLELLWIARS